jgi:hypothetical protein
MKNLSIFAACAAFILLAISVPKLIIEEKRIAETNAQAAGARKGDRCYNGSYWEQCGPAEKAEPEPPKATRTEIGDLPGGKLFMFETRGDRVYVVTGVGYSIAAVSKGVCQ